MIIYPAIDLKDGNCVRLYKGNMDEATIYHDDVSVPAVAFARAGFNWLHVVDLNGAIDGKPVNAEAVRRIVESVDIPVQLGGGIRTHEHIDYWLYEEGISRVILGTAAVNNPDLVKEACARHPGQIAVGIDARNGMVAVEGWVEESNMKVIDLAKRFEDVGVSAIIYTDIDRDGTGEGLNMDFTIELAGAVSIPVIASGGVGSLDDLYKVQTAGSKGVQGVIVGKAFYEKKIGFDEALSVAMRTSGQIIC